MEFRAYLIKANSSRSLSIGLTGVGLFFISILFFAFPPLETIALILSIGGIVIALIGAIASKEKAVIEVDDKMINFNDQGIEIRSAFYRYAEITDLEFYYHSFYSQSPFGFYTENAGHIEYGMANHVSFRTGEVRILEVCFLGNQVQATSFFMFLNELKTSKISYSMNYRQHSP